MATGTLKEGDPIVGRPNYQPITGICHMAFVTPRPSSRQAMHVVATFKYLQSLRRVFQYQIDESLQLS